MATNRTNQHIVMATFSSSTPAEQAVEALHDAGFTSDQIRYSGQFVTENFLESVKDLIVVRPDGRDQEATRILQANGGTGYKQ